MVVLEAVGMAGTTCVPLQPFANGMCRAISMSLKFCSSTLCTAVGFCRAPRGRREWGYGRGRGRGKGKGKGRGTGERKGEREGEKEGGGRRSRGR